MSLRGTLITNIDAVINKYIEAISSKYNIEKQELQELWGDKTDSPVLVTSLTDTTDLSEDRLLKSTKAELIALCKKHGCKCSGTKATLISRLLGGDETESKIGKTQGTKKTKKEETKKVDPSSTRIVKRILDNKQTLSIRRNQFNNYEHPETGLVFVNKQVVGRQNSNGSIDTLSGDDIQNCNKFKFSYKLPETIATNKAYQEEAKDEENEVVDDEESEEEVEEEEESEKEIEDDSGSEIELESDSEEDDEE